MTEMLDQTDLTERAERLVAAALKAGADAADAVCVRGVSLSVDVRLGKVEETRRAEGDDFTLRAFVGRRSATVSANVLTDPADLAERAVAMAKVAPEDRFAGLAEPETLAASVPDLDLLDTTMPSADELTAAALAAEDAARAVPGVTNSGGASADWGLGGLVLATSGGFSGSYLGSRFGLSASAIAGSGTAMERDYDGESQVYRADLSDPEVIGRNAGERAVRRLNPRQMATGRVTVVYDPRVAIGLVGHLAGAINGAAIARKTSFLRDRLGQQLFPATIRITDDPLRPRGLGSRPFDGEGVSGAGPRYRRRRRAEDLAARQRHRARARSCHQWPRLAARRHPDAGLHQPDAAARQRHAGSDDRRHRPRPLRDRADRPRRQHEQRRLQPRRRRLRHREGRDRPSGERGHHRRQPDRHVPRPAAANDLAYRYATNAPTVAIEGMTVAGN